MTPQEMKFRQHYINLIAAFRAAFPTLEPPPPARITDWLQRYNDAAILVALQSLQRHPAHIKLRFTQESVGKAISAMLRADAIAKAVANASKLPGGAL
jgi:hypothetical protein